MQAFSENFMTVKLLKRIKIQVIRLLRARLDSTWKVEKASALVSAKSRLTR